MSILFNNTNNQISDISQAPLIKMCGFTRAVDVKVAIQNNVNAIGLVFYKPSSRYVSLEQAYLLTKEIPKHIQIVGLFVNESIENILEISKNVNIDMFQFHGDIEYETPEYCKNISKILNKPYIKAIGVEAGIDKSTNSDFIRDVYNKYINYENNNLFSGLLLDTKTSNYGGSGQSFDWEIIPKELLIKRDIPIIISGGINLDNLDLALSLNPYAVDLSSAIENDIKGIKDENKIKQIMQIIKNKRQNIAEIHDKL